MKTVLARDVWMALPLTLLVCSLGCTASRTVQLASLRPAQADVRSVQSLCVLPFSGPEESGEMVHQTILANLQESGYYRLVDPAPLQHYVAAPLYDSQGVVNRPIAIEAGARMGLDAILLGRVRFQRESGVIHIGDPAVRSVIQYELIDTRNGRTLAQGDAAESYRGELSRSKTDANSEARVFARLAQSSALEVARRITPHQYLYDVELAAPAFGVGGPLLAGNGLAEQGDWEGAVRQWEAALADDSECDEALYNLGLACEMRGDFAHAQTLFTSAARIEDKEMYRSALNRINDLIPRHQLALSQLRRSELDGFTPAVAMGQQRAFPHVRPASANHPPPAYSPRLPGPVFESPPLDSPRFVR